MSVMMRRLVLIVTLGFALGAGMGLWMRYTRQADPVVDFFLDVARESPAMEMQDAYKFLFHATRGAEHAIDDEARAAQWLAREWEEIGEPLPGEAMWEPLTPDGEIGRLHLRPFKAVGGSQVDLHEAFVAGAREFVSTPRRFEQAWRELGRVLREEPVGGLSADEWQRLDGDMRARGYPAVHHSAGYTALHQPAYRVLPAERARRLMDSMPVSD